ncbi:hypothetical protein CLV24_11985 [Pontibacter ummariensis]|uniref:Uncharacterized protein n=2 Tax=Pontibacter ummariensis TaxID=1610492 RepID=A0A239IYV8_9BACT|nr:hypothetical protein CLV24_11985 [Pontibacter ummariensis]SNS98800.1 hypothetical protein SAMN06296052_11985 [Pontibacter ummariensis]
MSRLTAYQRKEVVQEVLDTLRKKYPGSAQEMDLTEEDFNDEEVANTNEVSEDMKSFLESRKKSK